MKASSLIPLCFVVAVKFQVRISAKPTLATYAIKSIIEEYFAKEKQWVDVIQFGSRKTEGLTDEIFPT